MKELVLPERTPGLICPFLLPSYEQQEIDDHQPQQVLQTETGHQEEVTDKPQLGTTRKGENEASTGPPSPQTKRTKRQFPKTFTSPPTKRSPFLNPSLLPLPVPPSSSSTDHPSSQPGPSRSATVSMMIGSPNPREQPFPSRSETTSQFSPTRLQFLLDSPFRVGSEGASFSGEVQTFPPIRSNQKVDKDLVIQPNPISLETSTTTPPNPSSTIGTPTKGQNQDFPPTSPPKAKTPSLQQRKSAMSSSLSAPSLSALLNEINGVAKDEEETKIEDLQSEVDYSHSDPISLWEVC